MLEFDPLRSFVSVVDAGGFTRAGERVYRTQSTVSQQIRRLEETLGRELLMLRPGRERSGRLLHCGISDARGVRLMSELGQNGKGSS